jgi:hypothetical protein
LHSWAGAELEKREVVIFTMIPSREEMKVEGPGPTLRIWKMNIRNSKTHKSRLKQD